MNLIHSLNQVEYMEYRIYEPNSFSKPGAQRPETGLRSHRQGVDSPPSCAQPRMREAQLCAGGKDVEDSTKQKQLPKNNYQKQLPKTNMCRATSMSGSAAPRTAPSNMTARSKASCPTSTTNISTGRCTRGRAMGLGQGLREATGWETASGSLFEGTGQLH